MAAFDQSQIRILAESSQRDGEPLTGALRRLVDRAGYVDDEAIAILADVYNLSKAEVLGVVSFYHDFRRAPPGRNVIKICRAEACQAVGGRALAAHATQSLGISFGETTEDGSFTLESVYCLGLCACGPAAQAGDRLLGRLDEARFDQLTAELAREAVE